MNLRIPVRFSFGIPRAGMDIRLCKIFFHISFLIFYLHSLTFMLQSL